MRHNVRKRWSPGKSLRRGASSNPHAVMEFHNQERHTMANVIVISGNLADAPEIRNVGDSVVTEFRIAHNEKFKSQGRDQERTSWFSVERWGDAFADFAEKFLTKGAKVYVTGSVSVEQWESRDGKQGTTVKIRAHNVDLETWPDNGDRGGRSDRDRGSRRREDRRQRQSRNQSRYEDDNIKF